MKLPRTILLYSLIALSLAASDLWCFCIMSGARAHAQGAAEEANSCQRLGQEIVGLRGRRTIANFQEQRQDQLTACIEDNAKRYGITGDNLASIDPEPTNRIADSVYLEKPTIVQLRQVNLSQLIGFLRELSDSAAGLQIKALRLSIPPQDDEDDLWSAEINVVYLIYSPPPKQKGISD